MTPSHPSKPAYKLTTHILPPPGPSVLSAPLPTSPVTPTSSYPIHPQTPPLFAAALAVRATVFIHEQHCSPLLEIDADDARSWHWVVFASTPSTPSTPEPDAPSPPTPSPQHPPTHATPTPAATLRLIPHTPHRENAPPAPLPPGFEEPNMRGSHSWDGKEPYIMLGRLATTQEFRGMGIAGALVREALEWAGAHKGEVSRAGVGSGDEEGKEWKGLVLLHAQVQLEKWYAGLGFVRDEGLGVWVEDGIEHVGMWGRV